jgi:hypothetical protein
LKVGFSWVTGVFGDNVVSEETLCRKRNLGWYSVPHGHRSFQLYWVKWSSSVSNQPTPHIDGVRALERVYERELAPQNAHG